ncbi:putative transcription factor interactor and regulator CCHC(Zn) family [Dioscorea sansibarensis]
MMDSNNFSDSDASGTSNGRREESVTEILNTVPDENNFTDSTSQTIIPFGDSIEEVDMDIEEEEGQYTPVVNVEVESQQKDPALSQSSELTTSVSMLEKSKEDPQQDQENGHAIIQNVITGAKRARITYDDQQPSVHVVYKSLTRESKKKLMQLMQHWSEWEAWSQSSSDVSPEEVFESGEETYFPALSLRSGRSSTVSFWLDNKRRKEEINDIQLENESVPLYDRGYTLGSTSLDGSANSNWIETLDTSRCFNCGSYSHMLKECPRPRNRFAISNARRLHGSKRNQPSGPRVQLRYYQKSSGKIDDIKPGVLGTEAKEFLGIGESDPPPWLHRTQEQGHPRGYLEGAEDEDQPSGITIFSEEEETKEEYEEGELSEKAEPETPLRKMAAEFPGINAPSPANADQRLWAVHSGGFSGSDTFKHHRYSRSNHLSESHGGRCHERWFEDYRDDRLPSSDARGYYSPRYSPSGQYPAPKRSLSDRECGSPLLYKNSTNPFTYPPPPPPPPGTTRQSSYHSPTTSVERWNHYSSYNGITSSSVSPQQTRDRHDHHFRNHSRR